jgi:ribosomal-protein-alanine N-acetyltransferase
MREQAELCTARLRLRPFRAADAPRVSALIDDPDIARNTLTIPHPYPPGLAETWIAGHAQAWREARRAVWAVCLHDGELIGAAGLQLEPAHRRAELGYWIARTHWGRGFATEAVRALVGHAFDELALERVFAHHFPWNPASGRVLEKAGLRREGLLRGHVQKDGEAVDNVLYGLARADRRAGD